MLLRFVIPGCARCKRHGVEEGVSARFLNAFNWTQLGWNGARDTAFARVIYVGFFSHPFVAVCVCFTVEVPVAIRLLGADGCRPPDDVPFPARGE